MSKKKAPPAPQTASEKADALKAKLTKKTPRVVPPDPKTFLSIGSTQLNLALSGDPDGGVPPGTYLYMVGDSGSSKSWLALCLMAEASLNPRFKSYTFVHDNAENGALMDVERFFGPALVKRLVAPRYDEKGIPKYSRTAKEFYLNLAKCIKRGPCIYALDSMDALDDEADLDIFEAELKKFETGKGEVPKSMGMGKAKTNSRNINRFAQLLATNGSILVVVSQTRDKVGSHIPGLKTRAGGHALKFYAHLEVWASLKGEITRRYRAKDRVVGDLLQFDIRKNRVSGWEGKILVPFLKERGIDDTGGLVAYLLDERHWVFDRKVGVAADDDDGDYKTLTAEEFDFHGTAEQLVAKIEADGREADLRRIVAAVWTDIRQNAPPARKNRYHPEM